MVVKHLILYVYDRVKLSSSLVARVGLMLQDLLIGIPLERK